MRKEERESALLFAFWGGRDASHRVTPSASHQPPKWTGSLDQTHATTNSKPAPSRRRRKQQRDHERAQTHQAKQGRSSLSPRPVKNQTIKKRGSPEGPRPGPLGQSAEDKRVSKNKEPSDIKARPARTSQDKRVAKTKSPKPSKPVRQGRVKTSQDKPRQARSKNKEPSKPVRQGQRRTNQVSVHA